MSEKNQIESFVKLNLGNEDYMQKIKILKENTENLIEKMNTASTDLSKKLKPELDKFKNFLDQVSSKLEKIKEERKNLKALDEKFAAMEDGEDTKLGEKICLKLDNFRDYETVCGSKLFFMDSSEIWPELGEIYYKFVDETNDLPIEKRMPMMSLWRFMNILTDHFKKMGYNPEFAQVLFLTKIFFDALEIRGFENPSFHVRKLLKHAFIEPVTPTSEMSVYGLELNIQLTNLLYDTFAMCTDGKMRTKCLGNFARSLKIVDDQPKKITSSEVWLKEAFISQIELSFLELCKNNFKDRLKDALTIPIQDELSFPELFGPQNKNELFCHELFEELSKNKNYFEDYLKNKDISVKNKLAFICGLTGVGYINFNNIEKYFCGVASTDLRIFIYTHGLTHFPGYRTILGESIRSAVSEVKSSFILNKTFDFKSKAFNDKLTDSPIWKLDDVKLGSLELDSFLKLELKGYGSKELNQKEKKELAKECYCYKEISEKSKSNRCQIKLMFNCKFDTGYKVKNLLMEQDTLATERKLKQFEEEVLEFLSVEKKERNIKDLKNIAKAACKVRYSSYGMDYDIDFIKGGVMYLVFELYSFLKESDKTFKNLYDFLSVFSSKAREVYRKKINKILEHLFGKGNEKLREIEDKEVNVENIFKYTNFSLYMPVIFCCVKRSDITEKAILDYIVKFTPEERSNDSKYSGYYDRFESIFKMKKALECLWPTSIHKIRPTLARFEEQNDFYKLVTYKYLGRHYRKDLSVFKKLPLKFGDLYIEELNLKDPKIGMEIYNLLSGYHYFYWYISLFSSDVQNIIFADLKESGRKYYYGKLANENRNLDNLLLVPEDQRHECFGYMDSKYRTAKNLKYIKSSDRDVVFACYLTPEETTYENFIKYLDKPQRKNLSLLRNAKNYEDKMRYFSNFSNKEKWKKRGLMNQFKEWYKKSLSLKEAEEINFIGKKLKNDDTLDFGQQGRRKMPKLENISQKDKAKDNKNDQEH